MFVDNTRNRMLIFFLASFVTVSLSWNVKQLFDITYYQRLVSETQEVIGNLLNAPVSAVLPMVAVSHLPVIGSAVIEPLEVKNTPVDRKEPKKSEVQCLAENIYNEAGNQSLVGKVAVGQVVLNRMNSPKYPKTACGVVNQRIDGVCMFSWKCEEHRPVSNQRAWKESQRVAYELLSRDRSEIIDITEGATHFHSVKVRPGWKHHRVTRIDDHIFYRQ